LRIKETKIKNQKQEQQKIHKQKPKKNQNTVLGQPALDD